FLAKIASDMNKPDGLTIISSEKVHDFVYDLPVKCTPGAGPKMIEELKEMGIVTLGDVHGFPEKVLEKKLGKFGRRLKELSLGIDSTPVTPSLIPKSISAEETLPFDTADTEILKRQLLKHAVKVGYQLRKTGLKGKTVFIKLKRSDFKQLTRSRTIYPPTCSSKVIYQEASRLFNACDRNQKIRLIGLGVSGFVTASSPAQLNLFEGTEHEENNWEKIDKTIDLIHKQFGKEILNRAILT
ncbi:MAG: DNA polymerase IV, partial [Desulfobacterales bacterium]